MRFKKTKDMFCSHDIYIMHSTESSIQSDLNFI